MVDCDIGIFRYFQGATLVACLAPWAFARFLTQTFGFQRAVLDFGGWHGTVSAVFWVFVTGQSLCEPRILRHEL
jgi:hypothetical protein